MDIQVTYGTVKTVRSQEPNISTNVILLTIGEGEIYETRNHIKPERSCIMRLELILLPLSFIVCVLWCIHHGII